MPPTYSLAELAQLADVTPRTIRYYIAQGLLPSPGSAGPGARYSEAHLLRIRLVKELQREHLPLADIRARLVALSDDEVRQLLEERSTPRVAESALDYVRSVLAGEKRAPATFAIAMRSPGPLARRPPVPAMPSLASGMLPGFASPSAEDGGPAARDAPRSEATPDRSQWDRVRLSPDVELHIRRPLSRTQNKRVERLIALARELLEEDQP